VQTTLLGIGIAIILALLTALVGPLFIDWGAYRGQIEAEASRVLGVPVRIAGKIDVRVLPSPSLAFNQVEVGAAGSGQTLAARRLAMELGLATLMRGEFRADTLAIDGLDLAVGVDRFGSIAMPLPSVAFDPDRLAINKLTVTHGRIAFSDVMSGARLALDDVTLNGDVRSLLGPFKADGTFTAKGGSYGFRVSGSHRADDGGMKLRLAVDAAEQALAFESDGTIWIDAGSPRYDGSVSLSRVVGTALPDGKLAMNEPWKITSKLKATSGSALFEQLEFSYGPEVRAVRLTGTAIMDFGRDPRLATVLAARQIDLDRVLGGGDQKRLPADLIKAMTDAIAGWAPPPLPLRVTLGADSLTVGGGTLTAVRGDLAHDSDGWSLDTLEMRAPGATFVNVSGKLALADGRPEFNGPVKIDSSDPAMFLAWVEGRSAVGRPALGPMRVGGTVTVGGERIAVEGLAADIDRKPLRGRLAYRFATTAAPARLDATLNAADIDIDRYLTVGNALFASTSFDVPSEIALSLDLGHATYEGLEARKVNAALAFDASGLKIERLSIADFGGASLDASGRVDNAVTALRGSIAMSLAAPQLDGIAVLADKLSPKSADLMRKYGARISPLRVNAKLDIVPGAAPARTSVTVKLDGKIAGMDLNLDVAGAGDISDPAAAPIQIKGRLDAADARAIAGLIGLDTLVVADARPARLAFLASGSANGSFRVESTLTGVDLNASAKGTMTATGDGTLDVALRAADSRLPRRAGAGPVPVDLRSRVTVQGTDIGLADLAGNIAGATIKGRLVLGLGPSLRVDGRIETDRVDAAELIAVATGAPRPAGRDPAVEWPTEPFAQVALPAMEGRIEFRAATANWGMGLVTRDTAGTATFAGPIYSLNGVTGTLAGGALALDAEVRRDANGLSLQSHARLSNADLPALLAGALRVPASGRISLDVEAQGQGLSPASLMGALKGTGTATVERVEVVNLDPMAIDTVLVALDRDRGLTGNPARVADLASAGLDAGKLKLPFAAAPIAIANGRAQLQFAAPAQNADIAGSVSLGLTDGLLDARLVMTGPPRKSAPTAMPPALGVTFKGPVTAARRTADVASLIEWAVARTLEQDAKTLEDVQKERQRIEATAEGLRHPSDAAVAPDTRTSQTRGFDLPATTETKPPPPVRRAPAQQPPPPPPTRSFNLLDLFSGGNR
jgi:large subunit ribosomal protein L24